MYDVPALNSDDITSHPLHGSHDFIAARIASRPGQSGHADGVVLEGKELEFYAKKLKSKRGH